MLIRYKKGANGLDAVARVYSSKENGLDASMVDRDAVSVIKKLNGAGFESYLVGGAVRDMMLGRTPKDFDVATSASPRQVHKIFYNSRIIGRRFRIVHITFGKKIIEVSTFRSTKEHEYSNDNEFGTIEEDSARRDFSINSLYYDPLKGNLIDFNNALADFRGRKIVSLIPPGKTFREDPVRMLRAVKYSVTTGFRIPFRLGLAIRHHAPDISGISSSRMTEEVNKILACGDSSAIFRRINDFKLLVYILPAISVYAGFPQMFQALEELDGKVNRSKDGTGEPVPKAMMYLSLVQSFITMDESITNPTEIFNDVLRQIKVLLSPITPPNYELESAAALYLRQSGIKVPKGAIKHRNPEAVQRRTSLGDRNAEKVAIDRKKRKGRRRRCKTKAESTADTQASSPVQDQA